MTGNEVAIRDTGADIMERVIAVGDLAKLTPTERNAYYLATCKSLGLNPLTRPFEYIRLNNRLVLYARRDCTDQLRKRDSISVAITSRELTADLYSVTCRATNGEGRADESLGVVSVKGKHGDALANALMKAETKAKRRVTLSIVGLGWLDETEIETIADRQAVVVNPKTGEIGERSTPISAPSGEGPAGFINWPNNKKSAFWATAKGNLGFDEGLIHAAFGVQSMNDYGGTLADARRVFVLLEHGITARSLTIADIQQALGHPVAECQSSVLAKATIDAWIEERAGEEPATEEDEEVEF